MNLSANFTLAELVRTNTGLPNIPTQGEVERLGALCTSLLQPIRDKWGPLHIDSGFRCEEVNKAVGGEPTSQHHLGEAADIVPLDADLEKVFGWIVRESGLDFGQAILEDKHDIRWIHISLPRTGKPNKQALLFDGKAYHIYV